MQIVQSGSNVEIRIRNVDTNDDSLQYNAYGYGTLTIDGKTLSDIRFIIEGSHINLHLERRSDIRPPNHNN